MLEAPPALVLAPLWMLLRAPDIPAETARRAGPLRYGLAAPVAEGEAPLADSGRGAMMALEERPPRGDLRATVCAAPRWSSEGDAAATSRSAVRSDMRRVGTTTPVSFGLWRRGFADEGRYGAGRRSGAVEGRRDLAVLPAAAGMRGLPVPVPLFTSDLTIAEAGRPLGRR